MGARGCADCARAEQSVGRSAKPGFHPSALNVSASVDAARWPVLKLSEGESAAIRGGFMVREGRYPEARILLRQALDAPDPDPSAAQSMGLLELRTGNPAGASVWFARAVRKCPQCVLARFYRALRILRANSPPEESALAIRDLEAFMKFNPVFSPPYAALAVYYARHNEHLAEACHYAGQASQIDPGRLPYLFLEGRILLEMGNAPAALRMAQQALRQARSPQEKSQAYIFLGQAQEQQSAAKPQQ